MAVTSATTQDAEVVPIEAGPPAKRPASPVRRVWNSYLFKRLRRAIFVIWLVATLVFFMLRLLPGNPVQVFINTQIATYGISYDEAQAKAATLFKFDPNRSILLQYWDYLVGLAHGDMGMSITSAGTPVTDIILSRLPWTLFSVGVSMVIAIALGLALGMVMAYRRGGVVDHSVSILGSLFHAIPNYLLALIIVVIIVQTSPDQLSNMLGRSTPGVTPGFNLNYIQDIFFHAQLPIVTYVLTTAGTWALIMKSSTTEMLGEDYVTVARARGLSEGRIASAYVGRNAVLPLVAQIATQAGFVVGGAIFVEQTFQYEGIGTLLFASINKRDYPMIQGVLLMITFVVIIANLLADFIYSLLDPRIRTDETAGEE